MNRTWRLIAGVVIIAIIGLAGWYAFKAQPPVEARATVVGLPAGTNSSAAGFARAYHPRPFVFPQDHGPHLDFQTEWWYYTGNLTDTAGRAFGYQLTFFRRGLLPPQDTPERQSDLAGNQVYFAHFAITDVAADSHMAVERFSRGAGDLAGASGDPFQVHLENWSAASTGATGDAVRLIAWNGVYSITLDLQSLKPVVKHGDDGLSAKSDGSGNASYYYSLTRMQTSGGIHTDSGLFEVTGLSWMDHEWSTSALGQNALGWDWFALQLSDKRELMIYRFRNVDGSIDPVSGGTLVAADGSTTHLSNDQVTVDVLDRWRNPDDGAEYPVSWRIHIPSQAITLQLDARIPNQVNKLSIVYWEGAVKVTGQAGGVAVTGAGYTELTGYSGSINGKF
ncbi:MAG: carotenoid 1,2-hydratase [Chloroflexi bacterium]|nr:carotenoid 1,2-hydratase [Chloroflexota bacterium]